MIDKIIEFLESDDYEMYIEGITIVKTGNGLDFLDSGRQYCFYLADLRVSENEKGNFVDFFTKIR